MSVGDGEREKEREMVRDGVCVCDVFVCEGGRAERESVRVCDREKEDRYFNSFSCINQTVLDTIFRKLGRSHDGDMATVLQQCKCLD